MNKTFRKHSREKGIALLFTLGILGLLTVLALSFASSAMLERKASKYTAGASSARILAQAGLNRAIAAMTIYKTANYENFDQLTSYSPEPSMPTNFDTINYATFDQLYKMNTMADGTSSFFNPETYLKTGIDTIHWIYVNNGGTTSGASPTYELTGRFAYLVSPAGGRLDPAACVESGKDESLSRTLNDSNYVPRVGKSISEIYIGDLEPTSTNFLTATDVKNFSWTAIGQYNGTSWTSYDSLFSALSVTALLKKLKWQWDWFKVGADVTSSAEVYWHESGGDGKKDPGEEFHRFNLARTDWDTMTINVLKTAPTVYDSTAAPPYGYSTTAGLTWFNNSALEKATFSSTTDITNQVAANLIDYCDTNSIPTSDIDPSTWGTPTSIAPTYTGNEKTPYINEFKINGINGTVSVNVVASRDTNSDGTYDEFDYTGSITVDFGSFIAEAIQIYSDSLTGIDDLGVSNLYIKKLTATVNYTFGNTPTTSSDITLSSSTPIPLGSGSMRYTQNTSGLLAPDSLNLPSLSFTGSTCTVSVNSITFSNIEVYLENGGNNVDYAVLPSAVLTAASGNPLVSVNVTSGGNTGNFSGVFMDWHAHDPRQNLNSGDWTSSFTAESIGSDNISTEPQSNGDKEAISSTGRFVSTAYIRNAPMKSPWELGAIHRGAKWETINLKAHLYLTFGAHEEYEYGDASLLDQVKMTDDVKTQGLINLKSSKEVMISNNDSNNNAVLRCLFSGIPVDANYHNIDSSNPTGTILTAENANAIAKNVKTYMEKNVCCRNRSEVVNAQGLSDSSVVTQSTDAAKEAIIGKSLALTALEPSSLFKVVVLAQTLKDVGGPYDSSLTATSSLTSDIKFNRDFDGDGSYSASALTSDAAKKGAGFAWFNPFTGNYSYFNKNDAANFKDNMCIYESARPCTKGRYEVGYDQITGEQKLVAIVQYDSTNKRWKVLSYELISE